MAVEKYMKRFRDLKPIPLLTGIDNTLEESDPLNAKERLEKDKFKRTIANRPLSDVLYKHPVLTPKKYIDVTSVESPTQESVIVTYTPKPPVTLNLKYKQLCSPIRGVWLASTNKQIIDEAPINLEKGLITKEVKLNGEGFSKSFLEMNYSTPDDNYATHLLQKLDELIKNKTEYETKDDARKHLLKDVRSIIQKRLQTPIYEPTPRFEYPHYLCERNQRKERIYKKKGNGVKKINRHRVSILEEPPLILPPSYRELQNAEMNLNMGGEDRRISIMSDISHITAITTPKSPCRRRSSRMGRRRSIFEARIPDLTTVENVFNSYKNVEDVGLTSHNFPLALASVLKKPLNPKFNYLFTGFDTMHNNCVTLSEFVQGLKAIYSRDLNTRLEFVFQMFDTDKDGEVTIDNMIYIFKDHLEKELTDVIVFSYFLFSGLDCEHNGSVSIQEFIDGCQENNILVFCFLELMPQVAVPTYQVYFTWDDVYRIWHGLLDLAKDVSIEGVDISGFHTIMINIFHQTNREINNNIFHLFDKSGDGYLSLVELLKGFSSLIYGTMDIKARSYFKIFNIHNDESIKINELEDTLVTMKSFKEDELFITSLVSELDKDGDGEITEDEFYDVAYNHCDWMEGFNDCIFGSYLKIHGGKYTPINNNVISLKSNKTQSKKRPRSRFEILKKNNRIPSPLSLPPTPVP